MNWYTPSKLNTEFISGFTFYKECDYNLCPRYQSNFNLNSLNNKTVFLNLDHFEQFVNFLNLNQPSSKFNLLTHNSDRDFTENMFKSIERFVDRIYAINCTFSDTKVTKIPLGFNDQSTEVLDKQNLDFTEKSNLIYVNFKLHHHPDRPICLNYFKQQDWSDIESQIIPIEQFYNKLRTFKYCVSPRGTGIDTHRTYESLLFGVIPIVKKSELDDLYQNLPIVLVDNWEDVTYEFLMDSYQEHISKYFDWKEKNKNWYLPKFWL